MSSSEHKTFRFGPYLRDKTYILLLAVAVWCSLLLFQFALGASLEIIITTSVLWWGFIILALIIEYVRRWAFYRRLFRNLWQLDQAYLVLETLDSPSFYDGELLYEALYRANKSMAENIQNYRTTAHEFQEYVEMWIHEVKTPLATLALISHDPKINAQIKSLDDYVEQILFFTRAENAERDYLIGEVNLATAVGNVLNRNREILLAKHIEVSTHGLEREVRTDSKWLEFIIGQIINNSIKYHSTKIEITAQHQQRLTTLKIRDNGLGINEKDLPRIFEKSFTGSNGRRTGNSTGMGLYIVKTLCDKLGHQISVNSEVGKFTEMSITFSQDDFYHVVEGNSAREKLTKK